MFAQVGSSELSRTGSLSMLAVEFVELAACAPILNPTLFTHTSMEKFVLRGEEAAAAALRDAQQSAAGANTGRQRLRQTTIADGSKVVRP